MNNFTKISICGSSILIIIGILFYLNYENENEY
jgi:hypothetical protein